ncbi:MAG: hypothetical protein GY798_29720 [Hyphomicrobiales bacterium]|nr:hypothetical protein [Hyphomicrobiales bacterium]
MADNVLLFEKDFADGKLSLTAERGGNEGAISKFVVAMKFGGNDLATLDATLVRQVDPFFVPDDLIDASVNPARLKSRSQLEAQARHEIERLDELRTALQARLADPIQLEPNIAGVTFDTLELRLAPALLDPPLNVSDDTVLVELKANRKVKANLTGEGLPGEIEGTIGFELTLTPRMLNNAADALCGLLSFELPAMPAFDLNLPRFAMPELSLDGIELNLPKWDVDWPSLLPVTLPRMPGLGLTADWTPKDDNRLKVTVDQGDLKIEREKPIDLGTLTVKHNGTDTVLTSTLKDLTFSDGDLKVEVETQLESKEIELGEVKIDDLPVKVIIGASKLKIVADLSANPVEVTLTHDFPRITVLAHDDPEVFLHLGLTLETGITDRGIDTKVTRLEVLDPYPLDLLADLAGQFVEAVGGVIRLIGQIRLPRADMPDTGLAAKLRQLLNRVLDLMEAAMRWLGRQAAAAGKAIAGAAEAVARLIRNLIKELVDRDAPDFSFLAVEVRLNPNHWRLEQIILTPAGDPAGGEYITSFLGIDVTASAKFRPAMVLNFAGSDWYGLALLPKDNDASVSLGTDLWLKTGSGPQKPVGTLPDEEDAAARPPRLVQLSAKAKDGVTEGKQNVLVLAAVQDGKLKLFQNAPQSEVQQIKIPNGPDRTALSMGVSDALSDAKLDEFVDVDVDIKTDEIKKRALALMPKSSGDGSSLLQKIKITDVKTKPDIANRKLGLTFTLQIHLTDGFAPEADLGVEVSLTDFSAKITAGDRIAIKTDKERLAYKPLGLDVQIVPKKPLARWEVFALDLKRGGERFALGNDANATVAYRRVSSSGKGLVFTLREFAASRSGFDLEASVKSDNPVTLGGVDVPFRFTSGDLSIAASKFKGASLAGSGQLPPALIGEANASIALQLGAGPGGSVEVLGATALLDKSGDPIRCSATMFELTITELGFDFINDGNYHFYFLLTGSAAFRPEGGLFDSGLLKNFKELEIKLDKAPLGGDPRVLMRSLEFLIKVDPPKQTNFFDLFRFDLKGIGFYPAADKFGGDPAMAISGQVKFAEFGDKISPRFDFHKMWIAGPSSDGVLPRVRFDGLGVGLKTGAIDVEATAIAVDENMPDLYRPDVLPANVRAEGFLAKGRLDIKGWASMSAALGFLQLSRRDVPSNPRHAFFMYGQLEKLTEPIDTPVGRIYLREAGFGFGYRYTLAGIAQAETATSPRDLVRILDEVSKYQGSLNQFEAWEPTYDNSDLTLALRGMFSIGAHYPQPQYSSQKERDIPNPLLFDIVAALRTDLTFLINLRGWIATNYNDWIEAPTNAAWKSNPSMRGYLYFSVPRKEFLARAISERGGHVGKHPDLPEPLVKAIQGVSFSSTLYIRPGLFHMEFGWPYELGVELGDRGGTFWLSLKGGLINRIEDFSLLYGMAFKADGGVRFGGRIGNDNFGASASAYAIFALEAKIISYLSLQRFSDSMFYGLLRFDATLGVSVSVWISFKIFRKRIRLSVGFSLHLAMSIALEAVITPNGLGGRAQVSVGVRAFGRTLSVGIGVKFNDGLLNQARARVAQFQALGLGTEVPPASEDGRRTETLPRPAPPRPELVADGDARLGDFDIAPPRPPQPVPDDALEEFTGQDFATSQFWAMLFPIGSDRYLMQLIPRDGTLSGNVTGLDVPKNTFFASPGADGTATHKLMFDPGLAEHLKPVMLPGETPPDPVGDDLTMPMKLDTVVEENAGEENGESRHLELRDVMSTLFLRNDKRVDDDIVSELSEPAVREVTWNKIDVPEGKDAAAEVLGDFARSREALTGQARREAEIEESRSAVIAAIMDTAEQIAAALAGTDAAPGRISEIDARAFGLTFEVDETGVNALFPPTDDPTPREGRLKVVKSDAAAAKGHVHLFNPPDRMFRKAQPRMRPVHELTPDGIKLNWDLEPAWAASETPYDDPEFHLRRYMIRRRITGLAGGEEYAARFECKAATPIRIKGGTCETTRAPYQFVDDLRRQDATETSQARDIPEEVRNAILGLGDSPAHTPQLQVEYDILPIDIAGTGDVGEPHNVPAAPRVQPAPVSPIEATLQLVYSAMPSLAANAEDAPDFGPDPAADPAPHPRLMLRSPLQSQDEGKPVNNTPEPPRAGTEFDLRILRETAVPSGGFGSDAVSEGLRRLGEDQIDRLSGEDVTNFVLRIPLDGEVISAAPLDLTVDSATATAGDLVPPKPFIARVLDAGGAEVGAEALIPAIGGALPEIEGGEIKGDVGRAARLFLRTRNTNADGRHGEWRHVAPNIVVGGKRVNPPVETRRDYLANETIVETFERPVALEFMALDRKDIGVRSGRLHLMRPTARARLDHLLPGQKNMPHGVRLVPDPARRTATRVQWNVRASSLALATATESGTVSGTATDPQLFRWVSGFGLHQIDPDSYVGNPDDPRDVARQAAPLGEVRLLTATERGLLPDRFGDMERLEFAFPSTAWRDGLTELTDKEMETPEDAAPGRAVQPWFSAAESTAIFPRPQVRRTLLADFDDGILADLFAEGPPDKVIVEIPAWSNGKSPLKGWELVLPDGFALSAPSAFKVELLAKRAKGFSVDTLRRALRGATLMPKGDAEENATDTLMKRVPSDPDFLRAVTLHVTAYRSRIDRKGVVVNDTFTQTAKVEQSIDLLPQMHPVLADVMALLPYDQAQIGIAYRRYSVVPDDTPPSDADSFVSYLEEAPSERDPHGFAALRNLGLAAGFQLYDTDEGAFVRGADLYEHINTVFQTVLERYGMHGANAPADKGLPFVDVLTRPWGTGRLFWFDGGQEAADGADITRLREDDTLASVQISLRPAPDRVLGTPAALPVRMTQVMMDTEKLHEVLAALEPKKRWTETFEITVVDTDARRIVDGVAPPSGIEALPVHRLTLKKPVLSVGYSPATHNTLAFLRVAATDKTLADPLDGVSVSVSLLIEVTMENDKIKHERVSLPGVTLKPSEFNLAQPGSTELGMGRFTDLTASDWANVLFRPALSDADFAQVAPINAFQRLNWYAARRFGAIAVPVGAIEDGVESAGSADQRSEIAYKLTRFWQPFLTHSAVPEPGVARPPVHLSLGTVTDPGTWEQAPDSEGRVSVIIADGNRRGARRAYAVRPLGRYDDWTRANSWQMRDTGAGTVAYRAKPAEGLTRALVSDPALRQFAHATLPRTEPLEKPVILAARRLPEDDGIDGRGRFEVTVAHPPDMVLGAANRRNSALLAPAELSVGLWREYVHRDWVTQLREILKQAKPPVDPAAWDPMAAFGYGGTAPLELPEDTTPPGDPIEAQLTAMRTFVPDAWRGSTVFSLDRLPYFFRMHVLVHVAAGIVVSEHAATRFEEGFPMLALPWVDHGKPLTRPSEFVGYRHREDAEPPSWTVDRDENNARHISMQLPLTRIIDAMPPRDADLWFGETRAQAKDGFSAIKPFTHLPEPLTSYRITVETLPGAATEGADQKRRTLARTDEVDIRPISDPSSQVMYRAEPSGSVLSLKGQAKQAGLTPETKGCLIWTLPVALDLPAAGPMQFDLSNADLVQKLSEATEYHAQSSAFGFGYWTQLTFGPNHPDNEGDWNAALGALTGALKDETRDMAALADQLTQLFGTFAEDPDQTLSLPLPAAFWADDADLQDAIAAFFDATMAKGAPWLTMRAPATDAEIRALETATEDLLTARQVAADMVVHLLGPRRQMAVQVLRGALPPVSGLIRHTLTPEENTI